MHQLANDNTLSTFASCKKVPKIDHFWTAVSTSTPIYSEHQHPPPVNPWEFEYRSCPGAQVGWGIQPAEYKRSLIAKSTLL